VVLTAAGDQIDVEATAKRREVLRAEPDQACPAYLRIFHDALGIGDVRLEGDRMLKLA